MQTRNVLCRSASMFGRSTAPSALAFAPEAGQLSLLSRMGVPVSTTVMHYASQTTYNNPSQSTNDSVTKPYANDLKDRAQEFGTQARRGFEHSRMEMRDATEKAKDTAQAAAGQAKEGYEKIKEGWNMKKEQDGWGIDKDLKQDMVSDIGTKAENAWDATKDKAAQAAGQAKEGFEKMKQGWNKGESAHKSNDSINNMAENMGGKAKEAMDSVKDKASQAADKLKDSSESMTDTAKKSAKNLWDKASDVAHDVTDAAKNAASSVTEKAGDIAGNVTDKIKDTFSSSDSTKMGDAAKSAAETARSTFESGKREAQDIGSKVREGWNAGTRTNRNDGGMMGSNMMTMGVLAACGVLGYLMYTRFFARQVEPATLPMATSNRARIADKRRE